MKNKLVIKFLIVVVITILFCVFNTFVLKNKTTVLTILIGLACILPITLLVKFPEQKK